jgi:hypothetical protein
MKMIRVHITRSTLASAKKAAYDLIEEALTTTFASFSFGQGHWEEQGHKVRYITPTLRIQVRCDVNPKHIDI